MATSDRIAVMNAGRIEQVDAPHLLYTRPRTRFVAGFIGEANVIEGRLGGGRIALPGGEVPAPDGAAGEGPVAVAVRPERVTLAPPGAPETLAATLAATVYHGADLTAHLRLPDGTEVAARLPAHADPGPPGTAHGLGFAPGALWVLAE
jgi:ABC-type Fe3+/spermidine/putrescine transport system ATPase subunit